MPIAQTRAGAIFFAHVPKCAGSAVENYLEARFGPLALLDRNFLTSPEPRWSECSPQHIPAVALARMFPRSFFKASFAVVRHPHTRLRSVFRYQRDVELRVPATLRFGAWLESLPRILAEEPGYLDNHARPMTELVPPEATVFRLEDGLGAVVDWLDAQVGDRDGPREIGAVADYLEKLQVNRRSAGPPVTPMPADLARLDEIYAADLARFGYPAAAPMEDSA